MRKREATDGIEAPRIKPLAMFSRAQVCEIVGVCRRTLMAYEKAGKIARVPGSGRRSDKGLQRPAMYMGHAVLRLWEAMHGEIVPEPRRAGRPPKSTVFIEV